MKITVVAYGYPTPQDPRCGCFERDQALALKRLGHEVSILAVDTRFRKYRRKIGITAFETDGIQVYWGYWFPTRILQKTSYRFRDWVTFRLYNRVFKKLVKGFGKPDLLYAHYLRNIHCSVYLRKKYGIPVVGLEHWSLLMRDGAYPYVAYRAKSSYPCVDRLLAVSKSLADSIQDKFGVKVDVVNNMLGPEFLPYQGPARNQDGGLRFIAIGSLLRIKRYNLLIKAFAQSCLAEKGCTVRIIGEGSEHQHLQDLIEENGLGDSVSLLGRKERGEIVRTLRDSDVFVLSSRSETFGVVCIEAMSQGLPCIATRCGGPNEFITEKDGILVEPENQQALSDAFVYMYENHARYDREDISARCLSQFSPEMVARKLTAIFEDVLKERADN